MIRILLIITAAAYGLLAAPAAPASTEPTVVDLATALRLAGAQNSEVAIARERVLEAEAAHEQARQRFLPWLAPGISYRRHDGRLQDVAGNLLDLRKHSLAAGVTLGLNVDLGEAHYQELASRQLARAAGEALGARRLEAVLAAARGYFELARAQTAVAACGESRRIAAAYADEVRAGRQAGVASAADVARAEVPVARAASALAHAEEQRILAGARLVVVLRLPPGTALVAREGELAPVILFSADTVPADLISRAVARRPELTQASALAEASALQEKGARVGPLVPTLGATAQIGGLRGGRGGGWGTFADGEDYAVGLSWRLGPGGLFDSARTKATSARTRIARLEQERARELIIAEVVEAHARVRGSAGRLQAAEAALRAADTAWRLSRERRDFGVAAVLEAVQAEQEHARAQLDYLQAIADHNTAQYALQRAVGGAD